MPTTSRAHVSRTGYFLCTIALCSIVAVPAHAQSGDGAIARTYTVSGTQPVSGDLISLDPTTQAFHLSDTENDKTLFGVAVSNPILVLRSANGGTPIIKSGEAVVNVTTLGGPIKTGDILTSSSIPGKAEKASASDSFILGTALEPFPGASSTPITASTGTVYSGSIRVFLGVTSRSVVPPASSSVTPSPTPTPTPAVPGTPEVKFSLVHAVQYILAALVAIGSIAIAFRNFGSSINDGIVSVGRNPLAKTSIQAMVVLNVLLTLLISAGGIFTSLVILFLPI